MLLGLLPGCTVYDKIFHPYRLPSPGLTAEAKAKYRAAERARHKGTVLKTDDPITDPAAGSGSATAGKEDNNLTYKELPEGTKLKYDRQLLLKKPKLKRRQYHHYDTGPLPPRQASRENRRLRRHSKGKPHEPAPDRAPAADRDPAPAPTPTPSANVAQEPAAQPRPKEPKVKEAKVKEPKAKKEKKAPVPKPDPTLERPGY